MRTLLSGNEAIAHGAWEAGVNVGTGYPGTPSSEILPALTALGEEGWRRVLAAFMHAE